MPAFRVDAPRQIRHAIALFTIVWLVMMGFDQAGQVSAAKAVLMRQGILLVAIVQGSWLFLNAGLIVGLCQRQKLARMLELVLTIITTLAFIVVGFPFRVSLIEVGFFANAIATVLIYTGPCTRWFQAVASS